LLKIHRSRYYYKQAEISDEDLALMALIDKQFTDTPFYGSRQMTSHLKREGHKVGRKKVRRLMRLMGLVAIYQKPKTSVPHPKHKVYPYLLRNLKIDRPNQVWCADITYIQMRKGFLFLVAIMDWYSRKVLSWRLSNTMTSDFCIEAVTEAIEKYGTPEIFNTDQGSQFTSFIFQRTLEENNIRISMDGKGCWRDNIVIERFWRSLKYECIYLYAFETGSEARAGIGNWIIFYNSRRPHSKMNGATPDEKFSNSAPPPGAGMLQAA